MAAAERTVRLQIEHDDNDDDDDDAGGWNWSGGDGSLSVGGGGNEQFAPLRNAAPHTHNRRRSSDDSTNGGTAPAGRSAVGEGAGGDSGSIPSKTETGFGAVVAWLRGVKRSVAASHRTVRLSIAFAFVDQLCANVIGGIALSAFIESLTSDDEAMVGYVSGANGISETVAAVGLAWCTRASIRRQTILRFGSVAALVAAGLGVASYWTRSMPLLFPAMSAWGIYNAAASIGIESLLADSVRTNQREFIYAVKHSVSSVGMGMGFLISALIFHVWLADDWGKAYLVLIVFSALSLVSTALCWFIRDADSLKDESEGVLAVLHDAPLLNPGKAGDGNSDGDADDASDGKLPVVVPLTHRPSSKSRPANENDDDDDEDVVLLEISPSDADSPAHPQKSGTKKPVPHAEGSNDVYQNNKEADEEDESGDLLPASRLAVLSNYNVKHRWFAYIPLILVMSDIVTMLGAGMTVRFFALYFKNVHHLSPLVVNLIWGCTPIAIAVLSMVAARLSQPLGRLHTVMLFKGIGIAMLFLMSIPAPVVVAIALYVVRTSAMTAYQPLLRSIIMDLTPKHLRNKYNAAESINNVTWSASALVGGLLVENRGYVFSFNITAAIYTVAAIPLLFLLSAVDVNHSLPPPIVVPSPDARRPAPPAAVRHVDHLTDDDDDDDNGLLL
ncbi:hypothetical protein CAOG_05410 [Capsaspora owczarzaki ATCC 30864]|uniref:Major facilitator superfamily (MFS) profile domain-containing protein n=1 Tax=Capsaspora owczarzaki (strain ATCC 30864) TaxID=595528 RepID=A0A0D2X3S9_CAPO3|nr:hypothetical protein CAOG_05410 [Capsaspora owczarzaki ATCC 30864]KJE94839.1 hypothetical protein CAOG_005410 [Capsaspora owczarzaki ATCC 30864]|eukprot:XP_004346083.1 hypothetical protein CAOG_05410 [Capsaspora owczarzaki ATCC 30864]